MLYPEAAGVCHPCAQDNVGVSMQEPYAAIVLPTHLGGCALHVHVLERRGPRAFAGDVVALFAPWPPQLVARQLVGLVLTV